MVFLIYFSIFNCQKQNYRDVKLHSCECKMLSTKMERFMSVVNTIFYREPETEIVMLVVHICFHEIFMKRSYVSTVLSRGFIKFRYRGSPDSTNFGLQENRVNKGIVLIGDWFSTKIVKLANSIFKVLLFFT